MPFNNPSQPSYIEGDSFEAYWNQMATFGGDDNVLERFAMPGQAEKQAWARQMVTQQYQNQWNSEQSKMARAKEAGINLNTAAAAIAGGTASAVSAPSPTPSPDLVQGAASVGQSVASGVTAFTQGKANLAAADASSAAADKAREETKYIGQLAQAQIMEKVGILSDYFENNGCGAIEAAQLAITLGEGDFSTVLHILNADSTVRKYHHQMNLLDNDVKNEEKRFEEITANIAYLAAKKGEANANEQYLAEKEKHEEVLKQIDQRRRDILDGLRADPYFDQWQTLVYLADKYGVDSPEYNNCLKQIKDSYYMQQKGINKAEVEDAYDKFLAQFKADADVNAEYAEFFSSIKQNEMWIKAYIDTYLSNGGDLGALYNRLVSMVAAAAGPESLKFGGATSIRYRSNFRPKKGNPNKSD